MKVNVSYLKPVTEEFEVPEEYVPYIQYIADHPEEDFGSEQCDVALDRICDYVNELAEVNEGIDFGNVTISYNGITVYED